MDEQSRMFDHLAQPLQLWLGQFNFNKLNSFNDGVNPAMCRPQVDYAIHRQSDSLGESSTGKVAVAKPEFISATKAEY